MKPLAHAWRLTRVAVLYLFFAAVVAVTRYVITPVGTFLAGGDAEARVAQRCFHRAARLVRGAAVALGIVELSLHRVERLAAPGPLLVVANHPTKLDATFLVSLMDQVDTVVEVSWADRPLLGPALGRAGHLRNDDPRHVVDEGVRRLRQGRRLLIFPEGSRSPPGALHPFRRGAARVALASGCPLLPVVIRCDPPIGLKGKAWYDIPDETPRMSISVGEPLVFAEIIEGDETRGVAARKVTQALRDYFLRELNHADA